MLGDSTRYSTVQYSTVQYRVDTSILEHLDLTIHLLEGRLETDIFQKDIPIYISRKSCHPPATFSAVASSVATRLVMNCSLEKFLSPRVEEYTRYLMASDYSREEVEVAMREARNLDREELIRRPRRRRGKERKFAMVTRWDPRAPNIKEGLKQLESVLYDNPENVKVFPKGSIIPAFTRGRNLGEVIAPTCPIRVRREVVAGGSFPCSAPRSCLLHQSGALQQVTTVTSRRDGQVWKLERRTTCMTPNVIYYILCPCAQARDYCGSSTDMRRRWSKHKSDIKKANWDNCGLTKHFQQHHQGELEEAMSRLQVTLVDHVVGDYSESKLLQLEKNWILKMGTFGPTGLNTRNQLVSAQRRQWGL